MKKFMLACVAYLVITMVCAMGWHLVLFKDIYSMGVMRAEPLKHLGILSMLIQAVIVAYVYPLGYQGGAPAKEGLRFGLIMGAFMGSYAVFAEAGKFDVGPLHTWIVYEGIYFLLQFAIMGTVVGMIYGKDPKKIETGS